ncbi:grasp-with-spasm system SPASM domain peptide maturase [Chryseobacterium gleum]|uniref:grasp-with-spasm system SPASM domain peptide maturase n=1 Tax=Chryseobacterium gleum TaxID=250 RepID=UPI00241C79C5|nr:grasp-with-spasm system SPASM domain peptide maturase [Chryseobacterium gleum]
MRYFNLFSNIYVTKGATRILISDLQRDTSELMPLELGEIIEELKNDSIENIIDCYDEDSKKLFEEYLNFLLEKEYGFISNNDWDRNFPPMSFEFQDSSKISNIFIEMNNISILEKIKESIENLDIRHLVIYCKKSLNFEEIKQIDKYFETSVLCGIELFLHYHEEVNLDFIEKLNSETARIYSLVFYNCEKNPFKPKDKYRFNVDFIKHEVKIKSCGKVDLKYFNTNLPKILEAINHNSCLHKKIAIDINGNIKNCPAMPQSFGNIKDTTLEDALNKKYFKKYWNLTKDNIEVCKDCEFRYICTDCRAFTEQTHKNKQGLDISKPLKCGYDPYTGEWEEWSKSPLKQKAINFYGMQDLVKK